MCNVGNSFYLRDDVGETLPKAHFSEKEVAVGSAWEWWRHQMKANNSVRVLYICMYVMLYAVILIQLVACVLCDRGIDRQSNAPCRDDGVEVVLGIAVGQQQRVERDGRADGLGAACGNVGIEWIDIQSTMW